MGFFVRFFLRLLVVLGLLTAALATVPLATASPQRPLLATSAGLASADDATPSDCSTDPTPADCPPPALPPVTIIASGPGVLPTGPSSLSRTATFEFHADQAAVTFQCRLTGPGRQSLEYLPCTTQPSDPSGMTGGQHYTDLVVGSYTFTVHAVPVPTDPTSDPVPGPDATATWTVIDDCTTLGTLCPVVAPDSYVPPTGATFNNPLGSSTAQRTNLTHVIRTVNSMPGYDVPDRSLCPTDPALYPGKIWVSMYSMWDGRFANALIAADNRCISVHLLMNNHLSAATTPPYARLETALGKNTHQRSFAYRCSYGCRGNGVLHSKFYLFDQNVSYLGHGAIENTVMVGSSNMTSNASEHQWNDLYTVRNDKALFDQFNSVYEEMTKDHGGNLLQYTAGPYQDTFWPDRTVTPSTDKTVKAVRSIRCSGATGGAGINGHTLVLINMHSWHGTRGRYLARQVRRLYSYGCYVKILYSFMGHGTYYTLTHATGSRMEARRTLFPHRHSNYAAVYSHMKMFAASGNVAGHSSSWVTWTGSNNWADKSNRFDEVMLRISSRTAFNQYRDRFNFIKQRKSSSVWATFQEAGGGGRAPDPVTKAALQTNALMAPEAVSIDPSHVQDTD